MTPNRTAAGSEAPVTISGSYFTGAIEGHVRLAARGQLHGRLGGSITAVAPAAAAQAVDVTVTTPGGTTATVPATASSTPKRPELGRCAALKGGAFPTAACAAAGSKATFEWEPELAAERLQPRRQSAQHRNGRPPHHLLHVRGRAGRLHRAPRILLAADLRGLRTVGPEVHLGGRPERGSPQRGLTGTLVWEQRASKSVALLLSPEKSGALLAMQCGTSAVEVKGGVVVPVKSGSMLSSQTIKFAATKGVQEISEYETPAGQTRLRLPGSEHRHDRVRTRGAEADPDADQRRSGRDQPGAVGASRTARRRRGRGRERGPQAAVNGFLGRVSLRVRSVAEDDRVPPVHRPSGAEPLTSPRPSHGNPPPVHAPPLSERSNAMARIVVQTDDRQTVLEEPDVQVSDVSNARTRLQLMGRLQAAVGDAERSRPRRRPVKRLLTILPAADYREVSG